MDVEAGVKVRNGVHMSVFLDVDVSIEVPYIYSREWPDLYEYEYPVTSSPSLVSLNSAGLEEGYVGLDAYGISSENLSVNIDSLTMGEWKYVGSQDVYVKKDLQAPEEIQVLFDPCVTIGPYNVE